MKEQKKISIKAKLIGVMLPVVAVMIVILAVISYYVSANIIESDSKNLLESSVENQASSIESWLDENIASFQMTKTMIEQLCPNEEQLQMILDSTYGYNDNYPDGLYIADTYGSLIKAAQSSKREDDVFGSVWYQEGLTRVNMAAGSAYENAEGVKIISASGILNDGSDNIRVISADMTLDRIAIIVNSFIEMNGAEAMLIDKNTGVILANRDSDLISQTLGEQAQSSFYKKVAEKVFSKDYEFCTLEGNMTVFEEVEGTDWLLISYIPQTIVLSDVGTLRNIMITIGIIFIFILCVLIERVIHIVIRPVKEMTNVITKMTTGDFTVSIEKIRGNDEIAVMGRSVEQFLCSMKQMLSQMGEVSVHLEEQAASSKAVSEEMNEAAGSQSQSMTELNRTVDQLSMSVNDIAQNATELAGVAADTKEQSDAVEERMRQTVEVSQKGKKDMQNAASALQSIETSMRSLEQAVNKVGEASGEITAITKIIGEIAEETNLLSLNASIEAARAGDSGRGFAVVASQIGNLANNSANSAAHITKLITEVNLLSSDAVKQAADSAFNIKESAKLIHAAVDTFESIFQNIEETSGMIQDVAQKINQADQVAANVAAISEQQAASSQEILAASESMLTQANKILKNSEQVETEANHLEQSANQLAEQVGQFQI